MSREKSDRKLRITAALLGKISLGTAKKSNSGNSGTSIEFSEHTKVKFNKNSKKNDLNNFKTTVSSGKANVAPVETYLIGRG